MILTVINKQVSYCKHNYYWGCQCRSRQIGSSAFRKYHSDKAPMTVWNCGQDSIPKHCSCVMHCKHRTEGHHLSAMLREKKLEYSSLKMYSNNMWWIPKTLTTFTNLWYRCTCNAPRKPPESHLEGSINYVKKTFPIDNIWQHTVTRNLLLLCEVDTRLGL